MKKITYSLATTLTLSGIILLQSSLPAFATDSLGGQKVINTTNRVENHVQTQASHSANKSTNELQNIISRADTLITNRLNSLNELSGRLQSDTRLSASEKSSRSADIQKDISGLTSLKAKIDADTNVTTARTDAKSIITNYYIYAVFEPKTRLLITLNNLQTTTSYVQALATKLQTLINTLKSQGKDVSQLQSLLDDINSQINTINTTLASDVTSVENIPITTKPDTTVFKKVRQDVSQIVKTGFAKIRSDFNKMRPLFKQLIGTTKVTPTVAPSGTQPTTNAPTAPSTSPSPSPTQ